MPPEPALRCPFRLPGYDRSTFAILQASPGNENVTKKGRRGGCPPGAQGEVGRFDGSPPPVSQNSPPAVVLLPIDAAIQQILPRSSTAAREAQPSRASSPVILGQRGLASRSLVLRGAELSERTPPEMRAFGAAGGRYADASSRRTGNGRGPPS